MNPFLKVSNALIKYSCDVNHLVLPIYIYSGIHCCRSYNCLVDTNLTHMSEVFFPNEDARRQIPQKIEEVLQLLANDVDDITTEYQDSKKKLDGFSSKILLLPEYQKTNYKKHKERIRYYFLDEDLKLTQNFTIFEFEEYYYILNKAYELKNNTNDNTDNQKSKLKVNLDDLFCTYLYLKMRITQETHFKRTMHDGTKAIYRALRMSPITLKKNIEFLERIQMIKVKTGNFEDKQNSTYELINQWREE